jgi:hypothetical protein
MKVRMQHLLVASFAAALFPTSALAQEDADHSATIKNALSAAPQAVAEGAAVVDGDGNVLREGSNGYTCMPDNPDTPGNSPMCLDEAWLIWATAWMNGEEAPVTETVSFAYMLQGDSPVSNTDPWATGPTEDNEWVEDAGPHIMLLVPASALEGLTHDPNNGGPWVMWRGTSLAHVMVPTTQRK